MWQARSRVSALADARSRAGWAWAAALGLGILALLLTGCVAKSGTYAPLDWAAEMHYAKSYRSQEPNRLSPPDGAVPFKFASDSRDYTRELVYTLEEYAALTNPVTRTDETLAHGKELFRVNCSMCHGLQAKGDGPVSAKLRESGSLPAADLTIGSTVQYVPGDLYRLIAQGGTGATRFGMPRFSLLLLPEERWLLVDYVMALQGR
jgi:mono/diheme cytochrome c family protein